MGVRIVDYKDMQHRDDSFDSRLEEVKNLKLSWRHSFGHLFHKVVVIRKKSSVCSNGNFTSYQ